MPYQVQVRSLMLIFATFCFLQGAAQVCTTLGQNPATAFPVCGTTDFRQDNVPICSSNNLFVPGCPDGANYANKNPFWYKFTCFEAGTIGFVITPNNLDDDYDWQLYDITGHNPDEVYTNRDIILSANWAATPGKTGSAASGRNRIECSSVPGDGVSPFSSMATMVKGHDYILLVSHFNDSQSGYVLSFGGGSGVITDPAEPHLDKAEPDCAGTKLRVKLNKKMKCSSLTSAGTEFTISPAAATVISASPANCNTAFDFDELELTLSNTLPNGSYKLVIKDGTDGTTLLDNCLRAIPVNENFAFEYLIPQPIFADSIGKPGCAPTYINLYFPKKISCNSVAPDGSDFRITGPSTVNIISAAGVCTNDLGNVIRIGFTQPIGSRGTYTLELKAGTDGTTVIDECGLPAPLHTLQFDCVDTVSARFTYSMLSGCRENTLTFSHDGQHQVNSWNWIFNGGTPVTTQTHQLVLPATSTNTVQLVVGNGVCSDTVSNIVELKNEVKAAFEIPPVICPEDPLVVTNKSQGDVDVWTWNFERLSTSNLKDPPPLMFPATNREAYYTIRLKAENRSLGCADSVKKTVTVLGNCFIAVPTAFTPNNDGINDYLFPNNALKAENMDFRVFNRWGQLVFQSREWTRKWDGKINGIPQGPGVFAWFLQYTHRDTKQQVVQKGTTTLIR